MITRITLDDSAVQAVLQSMPASIGKAKNKAVANTTRYADKEAKRRMAKATGIKQTVFQRFRVKKRLRLGNGVVWLGYSDVKSGYVGKLSQAYKGAFAGPYYFESGFVAEMKSGHTAVFKRKGKSRLPIVEQVVKITAAEIVMQGLASDASKELERQVESQLQSIAQAVRR